MYRQGRTAHQAASMHSQLYAVRFTLLIQAKQHPPVKTTLAGLKGGFQSTHITYLKDISQSSMMHAVHPPAVEALLLDSAPPQNM